MIIAVLLMEMIHYELVPRAGIWGTRSPHLVESFVCEIFSHRGVDLVINVVDVIIIHQIGCS